MRKRLFLLPREIGGTIVFTPDVLEHMYEYRQVHYWSREAGGLLFSSNPQEPEIIITVASGPHATDHRTRHSFAPNVKHANAEIQQQFANGQHLVGLWHTHPETHPKPSKIDRGTAHVYLNAHAKEMTGFLLVTLGNTGDFPNLSIYLADRKHGTSWIALDERRE